MEVKRTMNRIKTLFFSIVLLACALVCAAASAKASPAPRVERDTATKSPITLAMDTASADAIKPTPVIENQTAVGNYANRVTETVERLDVAGNSVRLPEAPSFEIPHVPRY